MQVLEVEQHQKEPLSRLPPAFGLDAVYSKHECSFCVPTQACWNLVVPNAAELFLPEPTPSPHSSLNEIAVHTVQRTNLRIPLTMPAGGFLVQSDLSWKFPSHTASFAAILRCLEAPFTCLGHYVTHICLTEQTMIESPIAKSTAYWSEAIRTTRNPHRSSW